MFKGIDLFSDTVTRPSDGMRQAIAAAVVGDEQRGEDPTTRALEERMANLLGHTAAVFFPSATMANEVALMAQCERGDEIIAAANCHLFVAEGGGPAVHANVLAKPIYTENGIFTGDDVRQAVTKVRGNVYPITRLVSVENTTNMGGGIAWNLEELDSVYHAAKELGLKTHLDGSRLFNAVTRSKATPRELAQRFDSVTICFSKGLGCPAGAILAVHEVLQPRIRRLKQLMGGSLRQSGMLAAACLYALENNLHRLQDDHDHATRLAQGMVAALPQIAVENPMPSTNMVFFSLTDTRLLPEVFAKECERSGLRFSKVGPNRFRAVTHLDISQADIDRALSILNDIFSRN